MPAHRHLRASRAPPSELALDDPTGDASAPAAALASPRERRAAATLLVAFFFTGARVFFGVGKPGSASRRILRRALAHRWRAAPSGRPRSGFTDAHRLRKPERSRPVGSGVEESVEAGLGAAEPRGFCEKAGFS